MTWLDTPPSKMQLRSRLLKDEATRLIADGGSTHHSAMGATLQVLIRRLEEAHCPYTLVARPGQGYSLIVPPPTDRVLSHPPPKDSVYPSELRLRDTGLYEDSGKRIYTTAGFGYPTRRYTLVPESA